jgi:peroxiredoxin
MSCFRPAFLLFSSLAIMPALLTGARADPPEAAPVSFTGRVIDKEGKKPVAGARIVVARRIPWFSGKDAPTWIGDTTLTTDAEGHFTIAFPPDQVADPRLSFAIARVEHPNFVGRRGSLFLLSDLIRARKFGEDPPFHTLELERGVVYSARITQPDGTPLCDQPIELYTFNRSNISNHFRNLPTGRTDANGRFHVRMSRSTMLQLRVTPERVMPVWKFWGQLNNPDGSLSTDWLPEDLGTVPLKTGPGLSGRLLDVEGKPIRGQELVALGIMNGQSRTTTSDEHGLFAFGPLRPGNYMVYAQGQMIDRHDDMDLATRAFEVTDKVIQPTRLYFKNGEVPAPLELREIPTVAIEIRFTDTFGRPAHDGTVRIQGAVPLPKRTGASKDQQNGAPVDAGFPLSGLLNLRSRGVAPGAVSEENPEVEQPNPYLSWSCQLQPEDEGLARVRVPKGMINTYLNLNSWGEGVSLKYRRSEKEEWSLNPGQGLGLMNDDLKGLAVVTARAPTAIVSVRTEFGEPVSDAGVQGLTSIGKMRYGLSLTVQRDGRYRTQKMAPDVDYEFFANRQGYVLNTKEHLRLAEGEIGEVTLVLRSPPPPIKVGEPAPGFLVKALDGRILSLGDLRGKFVLLNFWNPYNTQCLEIQTELKAIATRFADDGRLAIVGLSLNDETATINAIKDKNISWPQAVLRDGFFDPIRTAYGVNSNLNETFLIDPDGKLLARFQVAGTLAERIVAVLPEK